MSLMDDLDQAERAARRERPCPLCDYIKSLNSPEREAMTAAAAGTIGVNTLTRIMRKHQTGIGRRTIEAHRKEGHLK